MREISLGVVIGLVAGALLATKFYRGDIQVLEAKLAATTLANTEYASAVEKQNNAILSLRIASTQRQKEYAELLKQPEKIKYLELKSDNCEDVRSVLDDIRTSGF